MECIRGESQSLPLLRGHCSPLIAYPRPSDASRVHGGLPVQLVGHSNGGNLCFVALKFLPKLVHSALLAAVPFQVQCAATSTTS